jgi:hypothetical protein
MDRDLSRSRAILISNAVFTDKMIENLPAAAGCAPAMKALLTSELCGWPADRVEILENVAAPKELATALVELTEAVEDVLVLYYVGHGLRIASGRLALALRDTSYNRALRPWTAMAYKGVVEILRSCPAATKLVILDCCYAELGNKESDQLQSDGIDAEPVDGMYRIWASKEWEEAESPTSGGLTYFTDAFIKVVSGGIPGKPAQLTIGQIFVALRARLLEAGRPEPTDSGDRDARHWPFALNAAPREDQRDLEREYESLLASNAEAVGKVQILEAKFAEATLEVERLREQVRASRSAEQKRQIRVELIEATTAQAAAQAEYSDAVAYVKQARASEEAPIDVPTPESDMGEALAPSAPSEPSAGSTEADKSGGLFDGSGTPGAEPDDQATPDPEEVRDATQAGTLPAGPAATTQAVGEAGTAVTEPIVPIVPTAAHPGRPGMAPAGPGNGRPSRLSRLVRLALLALSGAIVLALVGVAAAAILTSPPSHPRTDPSPNQSATSPAPHPSPTVSTTPGSTSPPARRHSPGPHPTTSAVVPTGLATEPTSDSPPSSSSPTRSSSPAPSHSPTRTSSPTSSSSPQQVAIPDVIGLTSEQATDELESDGFRVVLVHSDLQDRIYKYSPSGKAARGTAITIWC